MAIFYDDIWREMKLRRVISISLLLLLAFTYGCLDSGKQAGTPEDKAIITDRTGRQWDVTHARDQYAMNPDFFNFGLGVGAIPSVDFPTILERGDPSYSALAGNLGVFGVSRNGEQRAYSIGALTRHEVFNDIYPGESNQYVAVAY
jgi:hypothetical protein